MNLTAYFFIWTNY